jgi:hypothetical protein
MECGSPLPLWHGRAPFAKRQRTAALEGNASVLSGRSADFQSAVSPQVSGRFLHTGAGFGILGSLRLGLGWQKRNASAVFVFFARRTDRRISGNKPLDIWECSFATKSQAAACSLHFPRKTGDSLSRCASPEYSGPTIARRKALVPPAPTSNRSHPQSRTRVVSIQDRSHFAPRDHRTLVAVSQNCILRIARQGHGRVACGHPADCKSAIQQITNLRYPARPAIPGRD